MDFHRFAVPRRCEKDLRIVALQSALLVSSSFVGLRIQGGAMESRLHSSKNYSHLQDRPYANPAISELLNAQAFGPRRTGDAFTATANSPDSSKVNLVSALTSLVSLALAPFLYFLGKRYKSRRMKRKVAELFRRPDQTRTGRTSGDFDKVKDSIDRF